MSDQDINKDPEVKTSGPAREKQSVKRENGRQNSTEESEKGKQNVKSQNERQNGTTESGETRRRPNSGPQRNGWTAETPKEKDKKEKDARPRKQQKTATAVTMMDEMPTCPEDDPECNLPQHRNPCCRSCTPKHSFPCRIFYFLVVMGLDVADLASDWLLYIDVSMAEEGLVYGPPEESAVIALLVFSIIGTFTFIFEATNLWWEVFRNNPWLDTDLVSAMTIWTEDLPQIAINVYIALCREDPISVFQLSKASVVLIGIFIRILISCVKYCNKAALKEAKEHTRESRRHVIYRVFIMLGLMINAACAITVFLFTQTQRDADGKIIFQVPETIFEDKYNDQRYFQNVSVFIHHPHFDTGPVDASNQFLANWVRFMSINDIRDQDDLDISYNYAYETTTTELKMAFWKKEDKGGKNKEGKWKVQECYTKNLATYQVTVVDITTCTTSFFTNPTNVFITFAFTPPDRIFRKLIFGDIRFNMKIENNGTCLEYEEFTDSINKNASIPTIHYYRTNATIASTSSHLLTEGGNPRFYRNDGVDLIDITDVWQTGWGGCESSGSLAPHVERGILTECDNSATA